MAKIRERKQRAYAKHRESILAKHRDDHVKNAARNCARARKWLRENKARANARTMEYRRANPDKVVLWSYNRRTRWLTAKEAEAVDPILVAKRDKWKCHICKRRVSRKDLTLDHIDPVFHGGSHTYKNLATAHRSCNGRRGPGRIPAQRRFF